MVCGVRFQEPSLTDIKTDTSGQLITTCLGNSTQLLNVEIEDGIKINEGIWNLV